MCSTRTIADLVAPEFDAFRAALVPARCACLVLLAPAAQRPRHP